MPPAINVSVGRWTAAELKVIWHTHTHTHRNPQPTTQVDNNEYLIKWPERYLGPFKFRERKAPKKRTRAKTGLWAKFTFVLRPRFACYRSSYCCCSPSCCWAQNFISIINTNVGRALGPCSNLSCEFGWAQASAVAARGLLINFYFNVQNLTLSNCDNKAELMNCMSCG